MGPFKPHILFIPFNMIISFVDMMVVKLINYFLVMVINYQVYAVKLKSGNHVLSGKD